MESSIRKRLPFPVELSHSTPESSGNVEPIANDSPKLAHLLEQGARKVQLLVKCALVTVRSTAGEPLRRPCSS